jgi:cardiolipin synthase A/B
VPDYELHVGSAAFWRHASRDIATARRRVLVQAMTFEGDAAGRPIAEAIAASAAADRRVLVDDYTRHVINDTFLALSRDRALHAEAAATWLMFDRLRASGTGLRVTNPVGRNPLRYPLRNHKKLLVIDDAVWLGGINFSDHNFAWHDMMLRIADDQVADWAATQFDADWRGQPQGASLAISADLVLDSLTGIGNAAGFAPLLRQFAEADDRIELISAYPTFPFVDALAQAAARGVAVTIYTPRPNNKPIIRDYLQRVGARSGLEIRLLPEMTHVKAAVIDERTVVVGSSNFDFVSLRASAEYIATIRDPKFVATCEETLFGPARIAASAAEPPGRGWRGLRASAALRLADAVVARLPAGPRMAHWHSPATRSQLAEPKRPR